MAKTEKLAPEYLHSLFVEVDGKLFWKIRPRDHFKSERDCNAWNSTNAGKEAGVVSAVKKGSYYQRWIVGIGNAKYRRHRIIWCMHNGSWPDRLDHVDTNSLNDRIGNLRLCTQSQNRGNSRKRADNPTGYKGVVYEERRGKYRAAIGTKDGHKFLGYFDTPEEAHAAYCKAAKEHYGEFFNPG